MRAFNLLKIRVVLALLLFGWFQWRTDGFSLKAIGAKQEEKTFTETFHYLGRGRQSFVFQSQDKKTVIKFFNHSFLKIPWYADFLPKKYKRKVLKKWAHRNSLTIQSYRIAGEYLDEGIVAFHGEEKENSFPFVRLIDRAGRQFTVDLNQIPFAIQKMGEPFYACLLELQKARDFAKIEDLIVQFAGSIARRMEKGISNIDHKVEDNWGVCEGKLFQIDLGKVRFDTRLKSEEKILKEWDRSTHRFRSWLKLHIPESAAVLDEAVERRKNIALISPRLYNPPPN